MRQLRKIAKEYNPDKKLAKQRTMKRKKLRSSKKDGLYNSKRISQEFLSILDRKVASKQGSKEQDLSVDYKQRKRPIDFEEEVLYFQYNSDGDKNKDDAGSEFKKSISLRRTNSIKHPESPTRIGDGDLDHKVSFQSLNKIFHNNP